MGKSSIKATLKSLIAWSVTLFLFLTSSQFHHPEFLCTATLLANWWFLLPTNSVFKWFYPLYTNSTSILRPSFLSLYITEIISILLTKSHTEISNGYTKHTTGFIWVHYQSNHWWAEKGMVLYLISLFLPVILPHSGSAKRQNWVSLILDRMFIIFWFWI